MKFLKIFFLVALGIFLISNASAMTLSGLWQNNATSITIASNQSVNFSIDFGTVNPPATISAKLYNSTNKIVWQNQYNNLNNYFLTDKISNLSGGNYQLILNGNDAAGNQFSNANNPLYLVVNATVIPTPDRTPPVITILGNNPDTVEIETPYIEAGATAFDNVDGAMTTRIISNNVDVNIHGAYSVVYSATDSSGNSATATRVVFVKDTIAPIIILNGANPLTITQGNSYTEFGAVVTDNYDTGLIATINSSAVNINSVGSYQVTYNAIDSSGNLAAQVIRTVNVISANNPSNGNSIETNSGYTYNDVYQNQYLQQLNRTNQGITLTEQKTNSNSSANLHFSLFENIFGSRSCWDYYLCFCKKKI